MRVSSSEIFPVSFTISLHLSHVNPVLTEKDMLNMLHEVQVTIRGEDDMTYRQINGWRAGAVLKIGQKRWCGWMADG